VAGGDELPGFAHKVLEIAAAAAAAGVGDLAERAEKVTTVLDLEIGAGVAAVDGRGRHGETPAAEGRGDQQGGALAVAADDLRQLHLDGVAGHPADPGQAAEGLALHL